VKPQATQYIAANSASRTPRPYISVDKPFSKSSFPSFPCHSTLANVSLSARGAHFPRFRRHRRRIDGYAPKLAIPSRLHSSNPNRASSICRPHFAPRHAGQRLHRMQRVCLRAGLLFRARGILVLNVRHWERLQYAIGSICSLFFQLGPCLACAITERAYGPDALIGNFAIIAIYLTPICYGGRASSVMELCGTPRPV